MCRNNRKGGKAKISADNASSPENDDSKVQKADFGIEPVKFRLMLSDLIDSLGVGLDINAGLIFQPVESFFGYPGKFLFEFIPEPRKRLINVFDQKNTSLALALTSAEAVKGIRVVYPAFAATIILVGQA